VSDEYATLKFEWHETSRLGQLLSTHPTLQQRINYLQTRSDIL
jgi:Zn-dependent protease with chaperone function